MKNKIIVVAAGGLANRMRAVCSGLSLARATDRECVAVWVRNAELNASFGQLFKTDGLPFTIDSTPNPLLSLPRKSNLYIPALWQAIKFAPRLYDSTNTVRYMQNRGELEEKVRLSTKDAYIFSGLAFYDFGEETYRTIFRFSDEVRSRAEVMAGSGKRFDFGIHIRRTDNVKSIEASPTELFATTIERLVADNPDVRLFLATDSRNVKMELTERFSENLFTNSSDADRTGEAGMKDAAAEMLLLSETRMIYGSYWSSFSEAAAMLGDIPLTVLHK